MSCFKSFFYSLLILFYFYNVQYVFIPVSSYVWSSIIFLIIFLFLIIENKIKINIFFKKYFIILYLFCLSVLISLLINIGDFNFDVLKKIFALFVAMVVAPFVLLNIFLDKIKVLKFLGIAGFINSIFIILMFLYSPFRELYLNYVLTSFEKIQTNPIDINDNFILLRMIGITGFSAYATVVLQILFGMTYMLYIKLNHTKPNIIQNFIIVIILISAILSGRTSFILLPFFIFYYFLLFGFIETFKNIIISVLFLFVFLAVANLLLKNNFYDFFIRWVFEFLNKGINTGSLQTNLSMFKYDISDFSFFGDFKLTDDIHGYYKNTDIGWYRLFFCFGTIGGLLFMFIYFYLSFSLKINYISIFSMIAFSMIFLVMFKGLIVFDAYPIITIFVLLFYLNKKKAYCA